MDHLQRNVDGGLAGDENDATPIGRFHPQQIMTRQAHAAHKVYLDNCVPIIIGDLLERLRLVYAHVIDKNIDVRRSLDAFGNSVRRGEIYGDAADFRVANLFPDIFSRVVDSLLSTASDNDR